jgi:hypothetical protein
MMPIPLILPVLLAAGPRATSAATPPPIACRPHALDKVQRKRQQELLDLMHRSAQAKEDLAEGVALRLPADLALFQQAAEWIGLERRCCPFVRFTLEWKDDDTVWLRLEGGPGVKEAIAAEMGLESQR